MTGSLYGSTEPAAVQREQQDLPLWVGHAELRRRLVLVLSHPLYLHVEAVGDEVLAEREQGTAVGEPGLDDPLVVEQVRPDQHPVGGEQPTAHGVKRFVDRRDDVPVTLCFRAQM